MAEKKAYVHGMTKSLLSQDKSLFKVFSKPQDTVSDGTKSMEKEKRAFYHAPAECPLFLIARI
ncbi:MAG: hypothetical protein MUO52_13435 [Desulfobacterales bacterium]|nr:hypothetical protein [Desulfobacterales bacterium]